MAEATESFRNEKVGSEFAVYYSEHTDRDRYRLPRDRFIAPHSCRKLKRWKNRKDRGVRHERRSGKSGGTGCTPKSRTHENYNERKYSGVAAGVSEMADNHHFFKIIIHSIKCQSTISYSSQAVDFIQPAAQNPVD